MNEHRNKGARHVTEERTMKGLVTIHDARSQTRFTVYLDASSNTKLSSIIPSLTNATGMREKPQYIAVDGIIVPDNMTLAEARVHEGSWISLSARASDVLDPHIAVDTEDTVAQLRIVSGQNAGSIFDISTGVFSIRKVLGLASTPENNDCTIYITDEKTIIAEPHIYANELVGPKRLFHKAKVRPRSGVFVKDQEKTVPFYLDFGEQIVLPECIVEITQERASEIPITIDSEKGHWSFSRPPKIHEPIKQRKFTLPAEPNRPDRMPLPWVSALLPLAMSIVMAMLLHSYTYLLFGLMSPIMMVSSYVSGARFSQKQYEKQMRDYRRNIRLVRENVDKAVETEIAQAQKEYPDPTQVLDICAWHTSRLWNRRISDTSWLRLRIGTGEIDSHVILEDPRKMEFERTTRRRLRSFPVTVSLSDAGCIGCTGESATLHSVVSWMIVQMAALHSPKDLSLYLLSAKSKNPIPGANADWTFTQWLPHFMPHNGQDALRTIGTNAEDLAKRISELVALMEDRKKACERQALKHWTGPAIVIIMEHAHILRSMPGIISLLKEGPSVGIYTLCVDTDEQLLPEECQTVLTAFNKTIRLESNAEKDVLDVMPDLVSRDWINVVSQSLGPLEDGSPSEAQSAIPEQSRLLNVLKLKPTAEQIEARWAMYPRSTACIIGESFDGPFGLDIAKDGPHGLVAGTTGSGKSELLQTLVASLAVANTPEALNFVLIDYKGGAAFKDCVKLPHTVGMVTDLDNHLVTRALTSLKAELTYREHLLAKAGAKDLDDYIDMREAKPSIPEIPRLLIIIDEFASLVRELPDFMTGLVDIAQRGRSLGIHLLLATQHPGGVVSPEIRANANLRIALRMTDDSESRDVIDSDDAASISKTTPGRAVIRLGSSSLIPFQSARVGGRYIASDDSHNNDTQPPLIQILAFSQLGASAPKRPKTKQGKGNVNITDLKVLVDCINTVAQREHVPKQRQPWLPALPEHVDLAKLGVPTQDANSSIRRVVIPFALGDYPSLQKQTTVSLDLSSMGNMFIIGTTRSGKSTALKSIAYEGSKLYSPQQLQIHCIDGGNGALLPLTSLPNVGTVASRSETRKIELLTSKIESEVKRRADVLSRSGHGNIDEFNMDHEDGERSLPHILVMLDSWDGYAAIFQTYDGGVLIDRLQALMREGPSSGIHFILTGDRSLLSGRMSVLADSKTLLRLIDATDYMDVGMSSKNVPDYIPNGRGYRSDDGAEIQIAQICASSNGQEEFKMIRELGKILHAGRDRFLSRADSPFTVEQLPDSVSLKRIHDSLQNKETGIILGLGGSDNGPIVFNAQEDKILPIYGTPRSGKTTALITIVNGALAAGYHVIIAAPRNNALREFSEHDGVERVFHSAGEMTAEALSPYSKNPNMLYVFDDCQLLKDIGASNWLQEQISIRDSESAGFIFAGDAAEFPTGFGNWGTRVKALKQGILLKPDELIYQDLINIKIKRSDLSAQMPAGRGYFHLGNYSSVIQMALSSPHTNPPLPPKTNA